MLISTPVTPKALNGFRWNFEQAYRPNYVPLQVGLAYTMQIHVALWRELSGRRSGLWTVHSEVYHWVFVGIFIFSLMFLMSEFLGRIAVRRRSLLQTGIQIPHAKEQFWEGRPIVKYMTLCSDLCKKTAEPIEKRLRYRIWWAQACIL